MRKIVSVLSAAVLTLTLCACSSGSSTSSITVAGSTTCLPIAEIAAEGFKEETGIDVLVSGLGSSAFARRYSQNHMLFSLPPAT